MSPGDEWVARVHRAMDLVLARASEPLDLHEVARAVHASPFHFHRVFRCVVGETLHSFQKRVRLERCLQAMAHGPRRPLTDLALEHGFSSASSFSRAFRERYGVSPRAFDLDAWKAERRAELASWHDLARLPPGENPDGFEVVVRQRPERVVAYVRVADPYRPGRVVRATERLMAWADARGLGDGRWYGWQWESPDLVPLKLCRYDVGVEVPPGTRGDGPVAITTLPAMTVAALTIRGTIELELRALDWLYGTWLPRSGREPAPLPGFEAWHGRPFAHGVERFEIDVELPILPR